MNKHDRWERLRLTGWAVSVPVTNPGRGAHRSLVDNGVYGDAHRARQVVWLPSRRGFIRANRDRYTPWEDLL